MNSRWVIVGASPSAPVHFDAAVGRWLHPTTITTNGGIHLFNGEAPTFYWLHDKRAVPAYLDKATAIQSRGTQLVTIAEIGGQTAEQRGMGHFDVMVEGTMQGGALVDGKAQFFRDAYTNLGYSGLYCCQFAVNNGAKHIALVGMEGYRSTPEEQVAENFHDPNTPGPRIAWLNSQQLIGPVTQDMISQCPDIEFVFYGEPSFPLEGLNLEIVT